MNNIISKPPIKKDRSGVSTLAVAVVIVVIIAIVASAYFLVVVGDENKNPGPGTPPEIIPTISNYTDGLNVQQNDNPLVDQSSNGNLTTYTYQIATITNYSITPLTTPSRGGSPMTITADWGTITTSSVSDSITNAISSTTGNSNTVGVTFGYQKALVLTGNYSHTWSNSSTTTNEFTQTIQNEISKSSGGSASLNLTNLNPNYYYRIAYVASYCYVYETITLNNSTGAYTDAQFMVGYSDSKEIMLQYSNTPDFSIPTSYYVNAAIVPSSSTPAQSDVTMISSATDLVNIGQSPNSKYVLLADINLSGVTWTPFDFGGELDGNGHAIKNLNLNMVSIGYKINNYAGLFTKNTGTIKNLTISYSNVTIAPNNTGNEIHVYAGVIAGSNTGMIDNCTVDHSNLSGYSTDIELVYENKYEKTIPVTIGGATWKTWCTLYDFTGIWCNDWASNNKMEVQCGGIAGSNGGTISNCTVTYSEILSKVLNFRFSSSSQSVAQTAYAGGIVGNNNGTIRSCDSDSQISVAFDIHDSGGGSGGGLGYVGDAYPAANGYVGGIAGYSKTTPDSCHFVGTTNTGVVVYAPPYYFGADYSGSTNKAHQNNIKFYGGNGEMVGSTG